MAAVVPSPLRWAIVILRLDPVEGHEQGGERRALVVSRESFHRSQMASVCPISARAAKYPGEVPIPEGHAGQTKNGVVLVHQVRTLSLGRVRAYELGGRTQYLTDPAIRREVRDELVRHFGLDLPAGRDGAAAQIA